MVNLCTLTINIFITKMHYLCPPGSKLDAILPAILAPAIATLLDDSLSFSRPSLSNWLPLPSDRETSPIEGFPPRWLTASIDTASNQKKKSLYSTIHVKHNNDMIML